MYFQFRRLPVELSPLGSANAFLRCRRCVGVYGNAPFRPTLFELCR